MIVLNYDALAAKSGGDSIHGACVGFASASAAIYIGSALNWWNPVGWVGTTVAAVGTIACAGYFVHTNS